MAYWEDKYISLCKLLGFDYFKKYWPINGSYWNNYHIDKNSKYDMKYIITTTQ